MRATPFYRHTLGRMPSGSLLFGGARSRPRAMGYYRTTLGPRGRGLGAFGDGTTSWPAAVEQWRPLLEKYAGGIPIEFLLAWISRESAGTPCSYTKYRESGIFQLMPPDNTDHGGTTEAALTVACDPDALARCRAGAGGCNTLPVRALTSDEADEQVRSGVQYVNWARGVVHMAMPSLDESDPDFWRMVKMVHVLPGRVLQFGPGSSSWADFRARAASSTPANWLDNAEQVGAYGVGGGGIAATAQDAVAAVRGMGPTGWLAIGGIALAGALVYRQRKHGGRLIPV